MLSFDDKSDSKVRMKREDVIFTPLLVFFLRTRLLLS